MGRFFLFVAACVSASFPVAVYAQQAASTTPVQQVVSSRQQQLQAQLNQIEQQIAVQQSLLDKAQNQHQTLQSQIDAYDAQIRKTQLQIQAIGLAVEQLNGNISNHDTALHQLSSQLTKEKDSLAQILRRTEMLDQYSIVGIAFGSKDVSGFFSDLGAFASIKRALSSSFTNIALTSSSTEAEKQALQARLSEQEQLQQEARLAQQSIQQQESGKQHLLAQTKGVESNFQKLIASNQQTAAQIRSALFQLRDSAAIPFGTALNYAEQAQKATGVPAALTLGILKQETNLGQDLGTGRWRTDMSPNRDQPVFVYITKTLGLDPNAMPVSRKPPYGWGGAMGPGQFIPSTWVCYGGFVNVNTGDCTNAFRSISMSQFWLGPWQYVASKDRVRTLTGGTGPSNPWSPRDAIMATAMLMADNGAAAGTPAAERLAALRYFAGWGGASNPAFAFYGDGVMGFTQQFEKDIALLNGSGG